MIFTSLLLSSSVAILLHGCLASASFESPQKEEALRHRRQWGEAVSPDADLPCVDFARSACMRNTTSTRLRRTLLAEFNEQLDKELGFAEDLEKLFVDVKAKRPVLEKEVFAKELSKKCDDDRFLSNYLTAALEEIGDTPTARNSSCPQLVANITRIVLSDGRESIEELTDVISKVRDLIAFDSMRVKDSRIELAFRRTRDLFSTVHAGYLEFVRAFDLNHSTDVANWYYKAKNLQCQLPMRSNKFFRKEQLDVLTTEYFNCTKNWILDIDMRERRLCLSRAWQLAAGEVPMPSRLAQILHDLRSLNVGTESGLLFVRPAYAQLLLNTTDYAVLLGTLGFEIAREITRASYAAPPKTLLCFEERLRMSCSKEQEENCTSKKLEYIFDTVALKAMLSIIQKMERVNASMTRFFYSIPLTACDHKQSPLDRAVNVVFSQVDDFRIALECDRTSPMVATKEERCELI